MNSSNAVCDTDSISSVYGAPHSCCCLIAYSVLPPEPISSTTNDNFAVINQLHLTLLVLLAGLIHEQVSYTRENTV